MKVVQMRHLPSGDGVVIVVTSVKYLIVSRKGRQEDKTAKSIMTSQCYVPGWVAYDGLKMIKIFA